MYQHYFVIGENVNPVLIKITKNAVAFYEVMNNSLIKKYFLFFKTGELQFCSLYYITWHIILQYFIWVILYNGMSILLSEYVNIYSCMLL